MLACGAAWGLTIPLTKLAVSSGHQPLGLVFWQLIFSSIALTGICLLRRLWFPLTRQVLGYVVVIALLGTIVPNSFSYLAAAQLPAGIMAIVMASAPMFALVVANGLRIEPFSWLRSTGVAVGAVAVLVLLVPQASLPDAGQRVFVLVALLAPLCYGVEVSYIAKRAPPTVDAAAALLGASVTGAFIAAPLALASGTWVDMWVPWQTAEWALLLSSLCHTAAYTGYIWLVGIAGPIFTSQSAYVITLFGVLLSALILNESYSSWVWLSLLLMLLGLALVQPRNSSP